MSNDETDRLKMTYPSNNSCWRNCSNKICSWGQRAKPRDQQGNLRGQTAPLWKNPAKTFFTVITVVCFILAVLFLIAFLIINYKNNDIQDTAEDGRSPDDLCVMESKKKLKVVWIIIGVILIFLNAFCYCFLACKDYASDQDWSRYCIITCIFCGILIIINIVHYVITFKNINYYSDDNDQVFNEENGKKSTCKHLFVANLVINTIVCFACTIVEVLVIIRLIFIAKDFFFKQYVPHDAKCIDDDIIIME